MYDKLYESLFEIVTFINRPTQDKKLLQTAGVRLESALFTLFVRIGRQKSVGVVELADQVNRDYSTVSRQIDKLVGLGLVSESSDPKDKRVRKLIMSSEGNKQLTKIKKGRRAMMRQALKDWSEEDMEQLNNSLGKLAKTIQDYSKQR